MKHSKFAIFLGALTLVVGTIYATKTTKRGTPLKAIARTPFPNITVFNGANAAFTTVATTKKAIFGTAGGTLVTLHTGTSATSKTIYIK